MKGIVFDIKRFAIHDGPGIRTTVFLKGCPLQCAWCHNPESISSKIEAYTRMDILDGKCFESERFIGYEAESKQIMAELLKEKVFMEEGKGGVTFSGGEPFLQSDFLLNLLMLCKAEGLHTTIDTSGYARTEEVIKVLPFVNLFLYDIKFFNSKLHKQYTGVENELVWNNLKLIVEKQKKVIVRIPVISAINTIETEIKGMVGRLLEIQNDNFNEIHLLPFHKLGASKYNRYLPNGEMINIDEPDSAMLNSISAIFKKEGFKVSIQN